MEEQIGFDSLYHGNGILLRRELIIFTVRGNEIKLNNEMDLEFLPSEDNDSYIEYEYSDNLVVDVVNKMLNNYNTKLYLNDTLIKYLESFGKDINENNTLEGYRIEVSKSERILDDYIKVVAKKQLI